MKGIAPAVGLGVVVVVFATVILAVGIGTVLVKYHLVGELETQIGRNEAQFALISLLSKKSHGITNAERIVNDLLEGNSISWLKDDIDTFNFKCYEITMIKDSQEEVIAQKPCKNEEKLNTAIVKVPLPKLNYTFLVVEIKEEVEEHEA